MNKKTEMKMSLILYIVSLLTACIIIYTTSSVPAQFAAAAVVIVNIIVVFKINRKLINTSMEIDSIKAELKAAEDRCKNMLVEEQRYKSALENANEAVWEWNTESKELTVSDKWFDLMGYDRTKGLDVNSLEKNIIFSEGMEEVKAEIDAYTKGEAEYYKKEFCVKISDKKHRWVLCKGKAIKNSDGKGVKFSGCLSDISDMKKFEEQVIFLAYYDVLTKLPNRTYFMEKLKEETVKSALNNTFGAVFFIDLDNFKNVNDTLGHNYGDELLKQIARRLKRILRSQDMACRLGGDEFLILLTGLENENQVIKFAGEALKVLNNIYEINEKPVYVSGSIGIAIFSQHTGDAHEILKNADAAMYKAKESGKNKYVFFNESILKTLERKTKIEGILRNAIRNNELRLNYQPQYDIKTGAIIGIEALLRLYSSQLGVITPDEFIPIAEETGVIVEIGQWCLRQACKKNLQLKRKGYQYGCIAVNISAIQLQHNGFTEAVKSTLDEVGLEPRFLEIELTESVLMKSLDNNVSILTELKDIGVKVALDDFGTGYSSLNYIRKIPLDKLKIDRSFITDLTTIPKNQEICEGIIQMAHNMGLEVIAEGVEKNSELQLLKEKLCDSVQGYLYCKPVPEEDLEKVLEDNIEYLANSKNTKKHAFKYTALYSRMSKLREKEIELK